MASYLKTAVLALAAAACLYGAVFVDVGGKPVAAHAVDVWRSPVVQQKIDLIGRDLRQRLARSIQRLKAATDAHRADAAPQADLSAADRGSLTALINSVRQER
jgi:hypothetical protein